MGVFRDHRLFRLKFHFTVRLSRDSSSRKQSWPLMVHYFSTITWCSRDNRFSGIGNKVSPTVHGCTSSNTQNEFLSFSVFLLLTQMYIPASCCSISRRVSSQPPYPRLARAALLRLLRALSLVVSFYLFFTLSLRLFSQTRPYFRLLSLACLSDGGNERDSNRGESKGSLNWEGRETNAE